MKTLNLPARFAPALLAGLAFAPAATSLRAATETWTQSATAGNGSWNVPYEPPTDNMNWLVAANWSTGAVPGVSDQLVFGDVTADLNTNSGLGVNGRFVTLIDTDFLGDATSSLTMTQTTSGRQNILGIRQSLADTAASNLHFRLGAVTLGAGTEFRYIGSARTLGGATRQLTLGYGGTAVSNAGTLAVSFTGTNNNSSVAGALSLASGGTFTNSGTFTLAASSASNSVQGATRVNALIGDTTNSGTIAITRNGDGTGANATFDAAQGGIEFASLNNSTAGSSFTLTANNATVLAGTTAIADRAANLVVAGALQNSGTFTLNRTPLTSATDTASRTVSARFGSFSNSSSGAFVVNHSNASTALTTTSSTVELTSTGAAQNAGWLSLSGTAPAVSAGNIATRFLTQSGFANSDGGILTVSGQALLQNTGAFSNSNTQASRSIQGATRSWDTRGLTLQSTTSANAAFTWATGVSLDPATLTSSTSFSAENFTLGSLLLSTGSSTYTLAGGGDLLISGDFQLSGHLDLGDWSSVSAPGAKAQTLFFDDFSLLSYVGGLIANGSISASLPDGLALAALANSSHDAFFIGTVSSIPEPSSFSLLLAASSLAFVGKLRRSRS